MNSGTRTERGGFVARAGAGPTVRVLGSEAELRAHGGQTGGVLDCLEAAVPDGWGLPPHLHRGSDEVLVVLDGALAVEVDGRHERLGSGDFAVFPRGTAHGFAAKGPSRFWVCFMPPLTGGSTRSWTRWRSCRPVRPSPRNWRRSWGATTTCSAGREPPKRP